MAPPPSRRPRVEPLDAERYALKLTISAELKAELDEAKAALSHLVPDGDLEKVLRVCVQKTLEQCRKRKQAETGRPAPKKEEAREEKPRSRYIPAPVRREVWRRDGGRCAFVGKDGKRCGSTHQLEFDHARVPWALGGEATVENVRLLCRAHNQHTARQYFGAQGMARFVREPARRFGNGGG